MSGIIITIFPDVSESLSHRMDVWKCRELLTAFSFVWAGRYVLSAGGVAGHCLVHQSLNLGVCGGFYTRPRGLGTVEQRGQGEGQRKWAARCHLSGRKPTSQPHGRISKQWLSLTAPLPPPPEKQDLEIFQVKNQPSNSTVGYSKEKKNKNQCQPGLRF